LAFGQLLPMSLLMAPVGMGIFDLCFCLACLIDNGESLSTAGEPSPGFNIEILAEIGAGRFSGAGVRTRRASLRSASLTKGL
jgi:hypothetical protein